MSNSSDGDPHPAAKTADQLAWAVWVRGDRDDECVSVVADSEAEAREKALEKSDIEPVDVHIDGPFMDAEPGVWEFEFVTEHKERVVVEAPCEEYAEETAEAERDYRGEYTQTVHTHVNKLATDGDGR